MGLLAFCQLELYRTHVRRRIQVDKIYLKAGESKDVALKVEKKDIGYYNVLLKQWVTEQGQYKIYVGSSSRDIRLEKTISIDSHTPYSIDQVGNTMLG